MPSRVGLFFLDNFVYLLFSVVLALPCGMQSPSGCDELGCPLMRCSRFSSLLVAERRLYSTDASVATAHGSQRLWHTDSGGSRALELGFGSCGTWALVAKRHVESSQTRDQIHVPCIGRQILTHCSIRKV